MEGLSLLDGLSKTNVNIEANNLSIIRTVAHEHMISPLNTSVVHRVNNQYKKVDLKNEINSTKKDEIKESCNKKIQHIDSNIKIITLHNIRLILLGGIF